MTKNEILNLVQKVKILKKERANTLPENSFFLDGEEILCYPRERGDSRYPYDNDGLVLFAHSDGYMDCVEGDFNVFKAAHYNEDTNIAFFAGEKTNSVFSPISVTGAARQLFENDDINRYTVYTPACAYYVVETPKAIFAARAYIDSKKHLRFSVCAVNLAEQREIYLSSFFEPTLRNTPFETFFAIMAKFSKITKNGYVIENKLSGRNFLAVRRSITGNVKKLYQTTAKNDFVCNRGGNLTNALSLKTGTITNCREKANTTEIPVICDLCRFELKKDDFAELNYDFLLTKDETAALDFAESDADSALEEQELDTLHDAKRKAISDLNIEFENLQSEKIHSELLNNFLNCVKRQVNLCALNKNYAEIGRAHV